MKTVAISGAGVGFPFLGEVSAQRCEVAMDCGEPEAEVTLVFGVVVGLAGGCVAGARVKKQL